MRLGLRFPPPQQIVGNASIRIHNLGASLSTHRTSIPFKTDCCRRIASLRIQSSRREQSPLNQCSACGLQDVVLLPTYFRSNIGQSGNFRRPSGRVVHIPCSVKLRRRLAVQGDRMQTVRLNARGSLLPCNCKRAFSPRCNSRPLTLRAKAWLGVDEEEAHNDWHQRTAPTAMMVLAAALFPTDAEAKKTEPTPPPPTAFDVRSLP